MKAQAAPIPPRLQPEQEILPVTQPPRREQEQVKHLSWVAFDLPPNLSFWFGRQKQQRAINQSDVKKWPNDKPHITVRWGLHTKQASVAMRALKNAPRFAVVQFVGPQVFELPDSDVLVCRVKSPQLLTLYRLLGTLPNTITHADYNPHVTIAYLRKGQGRLYQDFDVGIDPKRQFMLNDLRFHNDKRSVRLTRQS